MAGLASASNASLTAPNPPQLLTLNSTNLTPIENLSSLPSQPTTTLGRCKKSRRRSSLLSHQTKARQREVHGFCTRATEIEGEPGTSSLFSPHLSVRIHCHKDVADVLSEAVLCFGANSSSMDEIESSEDVDDTWITSILTDGQDVHACAAESIGLNYIPTYEISTGKPCDWVANIQ